MKRREISRRKFLRLIGTLLAAGAVGKYIDMLDSMARASQENKEISPTPTKRAYPTRTSISPPAYTPKPTPTLEPTPPPTPTLEPTKEVEYPYQHPSDVAELLSELDRAVDMYIKKNPSVDHNPDIDPNFHFLSKEEGIVCIGVLSETEDDELLDMTYTGRDLRSAYRLAIAAVMDVIFNRAETNYSGFGTTLESQLTAPNQFHGITNWYSGYRDLFRAVRVDHKNAQNFPLDGEWALKPDLVTDCKVVYRLMRRGMLPDITDGAVYIRNPGEDQIRLPGMATFKWGEHEYLK